MSLSIFYSDLAKEKNLQPAHQGTQMPLKQFFFPINPVQLIWLI